MRFGGLLATTVLLAATTAACAAPDGAGQTQDTTPLSGNTSELLSGVKLLATAQLGAYRPGRMPIATEACPGSGTVSRYGYVAGVTPSVASAFGSLSGTATGALVGIAGRWGYYEVTTPATDRVELEIMFDPTGPATAFRVVVEPSIDGSLRAPYFVDLTPLP